MGKSSGVRGVYLYGKTGKWIAQIGYKGKTYTLGVFDAVAWAENVRTEAEWAKIKGVFPEWISKACPGSVVENSRLRKCIVCGKEFESHYGKTICGKECKKVRTKELFQRQVSENGRQACTKSTKKYKNLKYANGRWIAIVTRNHKHFYLGSYLDLQDAIHARNEFVAYSGDNYAKKAEEIKNRVSSCALVEKWENGYIHAVEFYKSNGHLKVSKNYVCSDGFKLGQWIQTQRGTKRGTIPVPMLPEREEKLNQIGMVWKAK